MILHMHLYISYLSAEKKALHVDYCYSSNNYFCQLSLYGNIIHITTLTSTFKKQKEPSSTTLERLPSPASYPRLQIKPCILYCQE